MQQGTAVNHGLIKAQLPSLLRGLFITEPYFGAGEHKSQGRKSYSHFVGQILSLDKSLLPQWCHLRVLFAQSQILARAVPLGFSFIDSFCGHSFVWME